MIIGITAIATLGPHGTCSEQAANLYSARIGEAEIQLYDSFESSAQAVQEGSAQFAVIPSAYVHLNDIVFRYLCQIAIVDTFTMDTPNLVMAKNGASQVSRVASHPAPAGLVERIFPNAELIHTKSNSRSALDVVDKKVDACLTTIIAAREYGLDIIHDFGPVPMGWNVFSETQKKDELTHIRSEIERTDRELLHTIARRMSFIPAVAEYKRKNKISTFQPKREKDMARTRKRLAEELELDQDMIDQIFGRLISESKRIQRKQ